MPTNILGGGVASDTSDTYIIGDDHYPDIFVGRFSAQNNTQLQSIINRSINNLYLFVGPLEHPDSFKIHFYKNKEKEIDSVFKILKESIPLELIESDRSVKTYVRIKDPTRSKQIQLE